MQELKVGDPAPDFALPDPQGRIVRLSDFAGRKVVLYFYPMDDTPGCTTEAQAFRDRHGDIEARNAVVLGVSPDPGASHVRFIEKFDLPFRLLSDADHSVAQRYGAWGMKERSGERREGILRSTFLVGGDGRLRRIFRDVKPEGHAEQVLEALEAA